jgi:hypothetical protein
LAGLYQKQNKQQEARDLLAELKTPVLFFATQTDRAIFNAPRRAAPPVHPYY